MSELISNKFAEWERICDRRFNKLKENEEKLNRFFIDIYGISDELTPEVDDRYVTVRKAELQREIKSLISYAVGCIFGRYSLDREGLCYAGGKWDTSAYKTIIPCCDNILTINSEENGLTSQVIHFVEAVYGADTLEENLAFISEALGSSETPRTAIHRYLQKGFFADHSRIYKKRPIYWQFSSGSKGAFRAMMYIHRYDPGLLTVLEKKYAIPRYSELKGELSALNDAFKVSSGTERTGIRRSISRMQDIILEMEDFLNRLHELAEQRPVLELDDGVKANYEKLRSIIV